MGRFVEKSVPSGAGRVEEESKYQESNGYTMQSSQFVNGILREVQEGSGIMVLFDDSGRIVSEFPYIHDGSRLLLPRPPIRTYNSIDDALMSFEKNLFAVYHMPLDEDWVNNRNARLEIMIYEIQAGSIRPLGMREFHSLCNILDQPWENMEEGFNIVARIWKEAPAFVYDVNDQTLLTLDFAVQESHSPVSAESTANSHAQFVNEPMNRDTKIGITLMSIAGAGAVTALGLMANYYKKKIHR